MEYRNVLDGFTNACRDIFGSDLVGVYLHGSLAMGCFNPLKSDIDFLVVTSGDITDTEKLALLEVCAALNSVCPAHGLEMSVVRSDVCRPFVYPTPFLLHFSPLHLENYKKDPHKFIGYMKGVDKDLGAHFTVITKRGITMYGRQIDDVFAPVPPECYFDAIMYDVENAREDIISNTMYIVLNLCRVLAFARDGVCLSKREGGEWGKANLPEYADIITAALGCYAGDGVMCCSERERDYADRMLALIESSRQNNIGASE